jgi:hypothetical protein
MGPLSLLSIPDGLPMVQCSFVCPSIMNQKYRHLISFTSASGAFLVGLLSSYWGFLLSFTATNRLVFSLGLALVGLGIFGFGLLAGYVRERHAVSISLSGALAFAGLGGFIWGVRMGCFAFFLGLSIFGSGQILGAKLR